MGIVALVILLMIAVIKAEEGEHLPGNRPDWAGKVFRPCCKYCAYWMPYDVLCENTREPLQRCSKRDEYTEWDYCCIEYDDSDTEAEDVLNIDDV